ncbi:ArsR/SmtB family transcription factor [Thalassiella azotivora]
MAPAATDTSSPRRPATAAGLAAQAETLRVLADPVRAAIVDLLADEQLCNCHLQESLGLKQTLVSHHLAALRDAGLVERETRGRFTWYRLRPGALDGVRDALGHLAAAARRTVPQRAC